MGWSMAYDEHWNRDIGYGVLAICDHPDCSEEIDRGLSHVCCGEEPRGGDGCGLYFCGKHHNGWLKDTDIESVEDDDRWNSSGACERCEAGLEPFPAKPDHPMWTKFKLADPSWQGWRESEGLPEPTPEMVKEIKDWEDAYMGNSVG